MPIKVLAFDGDDTLWHNESRFNVTQGDLSELVRRHVADAEVDSHNAQPIDAEAGRLRHGFPPGVKSNPYAARRRRLSG